MTDTVPASSNVLAYSEKTTALTDAQKALIGQGIAVNVKDLTISAKSAPDGKDHSVAFSEVTASNMKSVLALAASDVDKENPLADTAEKVIIAYFNAGYNKSRFSLVRQKLAAEVEGPEKKFESAAKTLAKTGLFTYEDALAKVKAMAATQK